MVCEIHKSLLLSERNLLKRYPMGDEKLKKKKMKVWNKETVVGVV